MYLNMDFTLSQLASVSDLQRNYNGLLEKVRSLMGPIVLLRRNQPEAVILSIDEYKNLTEKTRIYEENEALKAIASFEKDRKEGKLMTATRAEDLFK